MKAKPVLTTSASEESSGGIFFTVTSSQSHQSHQSPPRTVPLSRHPLPMLGRPLGHRVAVGAPHGPEIPQSRRQHQWRRLIQVVWAALSLKQAIARRPPDGGDGSEIDSGSCKSAATSWSLRNLVEVTSTPSIPGSREGSPDVATPRPPQAMANGCLATASDETTGNYDCLEHREATLKRLAFKKHRPGNATPSASKHRSSQIGPSSASSIAIRIPSQASSLESPSVEFPRPASSASITRQLAFDYPEPLPYGANQVPIIAIQWDKPVFWMKLTMVLLFVVFLALGLFIWAKDIQLQQKDSNN